MARHRRVVGKRHRGVKDPEEQRARREALIKDKINSAPVLIDHQEVPKKLQSLMKAREEMRNESHTTSKKKKKKKGKQALLDSTKYITSEMKLPGMKRPLKPLPVLKQRANESQKAFMERMNMTVKSVLDRKEFEDKFDVEVTTDPATGKTTMRPRVKDEVDDEMDRLRNQRRLKRGLKPVQSKEEKRELRRSREREKRLKKKRRLYKQRCHEEEAEEDFDQFVDKVAFNEVAKAPPTLKVKPKKAEVKKNGNSMARQVLLAKERQRVIEAYRSNRNGNKSDL